MIQPPLIQAASGRVHRREQSVNYEPANRPLIGMNLRSDRICSAALPDAAEDREAPRQDVELGSSIVSSRRTGLEEVGGAHSTSKPRRLRTWIGP